MISFCIITEGKRPEKLFNLLASIALQGGGVETTIAVDSAKRGILGTLRNQAARASTGGILVVCDDDITFDPDFCQQIINYPGDWSVMLPKILSPDWSRYWDWRQWERQDCQRMLDYNQPDNGMIIPTGAAVIVKRDVWTQVQWSETIRFYEPPCEDIDWGLHLHSCGYKMTSNPLCICHHDDVRYSQRGDCVMRITA